MSFSDKSQIFALAILLTSMVIGISTKVVTKRVRLLQLVHIHKLKFTNLITMYIY